MMSIRPTPFLLGLLLVWAASASIVRAQDPPPLFTDLIVVGADPVRLGDAGWGDLNGDGAMDLVVSGDSGNEGNPDLGIQWLINTGDSYVEVPDPDGSDTPVQVPATLFERQALSSPSVGAVYRSAVSLFDFDGDGYLDVAVTGQPQAGSPVVSVLTSVNGGRDFASRWTGDGVRDGDMDGADLDGDGDTDLVLAGTDGNGHPIVRLLINRLSEGAGFVEISHSIPGITNGSVALADYDLDGDPDMLVTGTIEPQSFHTAVYRNDAGIWTDAGIDLPALVFGHASWGDYDADGDPDILLMGARLGPLLFRGAYAVYENASGQFVDQTGLLRGRFVEETPRGRYLGSGGFADFDGDGLLDVFLNGSMERTRVEPGQFFMTAGDIGWNLIPRDRIDGGHGGRIYVADHDGDGDVDLLTVGESTAAGPVIRVQRNSAPRPDIGVRRRNRPPTAPTGLAAAVAGTDVELSWAPGSDPDTPAEGLTYDVRVGRRAGDGSVMPSLSHSSGRRLIGLPGNAGGRRFARLTGLAPGTYHAAVQAVDNAYAGSPYSAEITFTVQ